MEWFDEDHIVKAGPPDDAWAVHREAITGLFATKMLANVIEIMSCHHGFVATYVLGSLYLSQPPPITLLSRRKC